jgi:hypothetical protein
LPRKMSAAPKGCRSSCASVSFASGWLSVTTVPSLPPAQSGVSRLARNEARA